MIPLLRSIVLLVSVWMFSGRIFFWLIRKPRGPKLWLDLSPFSLSLSCWSTSGKESACQCRRWKRCGFDPRVRKIPWKRKWHPIPVFLQRESHGQKNLVGYSPWVTKSQTRLNDLAHNNPVERELPITIEDKFVLRVLIWNSPMCINCYIK